MHFGTLIVGARAYLIVYNARDSLPEREWRVGDDFRIIITLTFERFRFPFVFDEEEAAGDASPTDLAQVDEHIYNDGNTDSNIQRS